MAPPNRGNQPSPEQINAFVEQQVVNTRILSLRHAQKLAEKRGALPTTADELIADARKVEAYLQEGLDGLKKKSGLVITNQMPPAGAGFKPGD